VSDRMPNARTSAEPPFFAIGDERSWTSKVGERRAHLCNLQQPPFWHALLWQSPVFCGAM
jgi:hypothetical protein